MRDRRTWALYLVLALFAYLENMIGPAMPFIRSKLDVGYTAASIHFSAFALGGITVGALGDRVARRLGRHRSLWVGLIGMAIGVGLIATGPHIVFTVTGAYVTGLLGTLALIANQAALSDLHRNHRTIAIAESNVAASSAAVLAPLSVGQLDGIGAGWQAALLLGIPLVVILAFVFRHDQMPEPPPKPAGTGAGRIVLSRSYWIFWCTLFLVSATEWCVAFWGADFLDSEVGLSKSAAATCMTIFFAAMVIGRTMGSRLARTHQSSRLLLAALAVALTGFPIFWLSGDNIAASLVGLFIAGAGIANFYPLTIAAAAATVPDHPDQATARLAISGAGALLTAPLIVGLISDSVGMRWGFGIVAPLLVAAIFTTLAGRRAMATLAI